MFMFCEGKSLQIILINEMVPLSNMQQRLKWLGFELLRFLSYALTLSLKVHVY